MTQPKHTPGPWSFSVWGGAAPQEDHGKPASLYAGDEDDDDGYVAVFQIADFDLCEHGYLPLEQQIANAHLIAAVPDLYSTLRDLLDHVSRHWLLSPSHQLHVAASAALAKADGREGQS